MFIDEQHLFMYGVKLHIYNILNMKITCLKWRMNGRKYLTVTLFFGNSIVIALYLLFSYPMEALFGII